MKPKHLEKLAELLEKAGITDVKPEEFKRYGSARKLYNFNIDNADAY
jgi:methylamine---glutamate N-methyltransferase subunit B